MKHRARTAFEERLAAAPLFATLPHQQVQALVARAIHAREPAGMVFSEEGERGDELVVILDGQVEVSRDGERLATLGPGEPVGEMALFDPSGRRNARVVAATAVDVAYLGRHDVESLLADAPDVLAALRGLSSSRDGESSSPTE